MGGAEFRKHPHEAARLRQRRNEPVGQAGETHAAKHRLAQNAGVVDRAGYDRTPQDVRDAAHAQDARLVSEGALVGIAGAPVQVRNPDAAGVKRQDGAFLSSGLPIAGFAEIEAASLEEAVDKVSQVPCAVARGVVEVWPLK
ncbi:transcription initiation protein [Martelella lutilitoris]|uniref:transcription initiation protein n=1 Tax=Martelella lutilitoris TaxID=2583532 RepID=UPI001FED9661|nr:transcription initiation protein [Martelella lutilitoris]